MLQHSFDLPMKGASSKPLTWMKNKERKPKVTVRNYKRIKVSQNILVIEIMQIIRIMSQGQNTKTTYNISYLQTDISETKMWEETENT